MKKTTLSKEALAARPKISTHDHLDCDPRHKTILGEALRVGFDKFATLPFPDDIIRDAIAAQGDEAAFDAVSRRYAQFISGHASASLANYVQAVVHHVLPVMQTQDQLLRITRERVEDAVADGIIAAKFRFAPQLHTQQGLKLNDVMEAVIEGISTSPIPVRLIVCALRHEDGRMARRLADLCLRYKRFNGRPIVSHFDLAGDEKAFPGVPLWWLKQAKRAKAGGVKPTIHIWETNEPTAQDVERLKDLGVKVLGHGWRGNMQGRRVCTCCIHSYITTGQICEAHEANTDRLYRDGKLVTVDMDGSTFTLANLTDNYHTLHTTFGWGDAEFHATNSTALKYSGFTAAEKRALQAQLDAGYPNR